MRINSNIVRAALILLAGLYFLSGPVAAVEPGHGHETEESHEGHDHGAEEQEHVEEHEDESDDHEEHWEESHEGHDHEAEEHGPGDGYDHEAEGVIPVSQSGAEMAGIRVARAGMARVGREVTLSGEVGFNEDRRVHVTPRYGGIIREMRAPLGAWVSRGDVLAVVESNESLTSYEVRSPLSGRVVARDGAVGAFASEERELFVVADLSTVWVSLDVYPRHVADVRSGAAVTIRGVGIDHEARGTISYVAPVFDRDRRAALARVILANPAGTWRPGMFVRAELRAASAEPVLAVESDAVQVLDDEPVVFVPAGAGGFRSVPVRTGLAGESHTEIVAGLTEGDAYVADGAFELKAKVVTSSLGGHAGHGH